MTHDKNHWIIYSPLINPLIARCEKLKMPSDNLTFCVLQKRINLMEDFYQDTKRLQIPKLIHLSIFSKIAIWLKWCPLSTTLLMQIIRKIVQSVLEKSNRHIFSALNPPQLKIENFSKKRLVSFEISWCAIFIQKSRKFLEPLRK